MDGRKTTGSPGLAEDSLALMCHCEDLLPFTHTYQHYIVPCDLRHKQYFDILYMYIREQHPLYMTCQEILKCVKY